MKHRTNLLFLLPLLLTSCLDSNQEKPSPTDKGSINKDSDIIDPGIKDQPNQITGPTTSFPFTYQDYSTFHSAYEIYKGKNGSFPLFLFDFDDFSGFLPEYTINAIGDNRYRNLATPDFTMTSVSFHFSLVAKGSLVSRYQSISLEYRITDKMTPIQDFRKSDVRIQTDTTGNKIDVSYSDTKLFQVDLTLKEGYSEILKDEMMEKLKDSLTYLE